MPGIYGALCHIAGARSSNSVRFLDVLYGPRAAGLRASVVGILSGKEVGPSSRDAQYGRLRKTLLAAVGATGNCIASENADFEARAEAIVRGEANNA